MMLEIFKYIDRIFAMIRPRKLLYLAIDGVAPRAKMNQQRSRRFRAAQEARLKREKEAEIRQEMRDKGVEDVESSDDDSSNFDSNCITPGTPFMDLVARSLRYYIAHKINTEAAWQHINVILSDASVPGEGEHKIMDYIRKQRLEPSHDPNLEHVIYGLDADLIMLSMATHEARFHVLREDVFADEKERSTACFKCGRQGHMADRCTEETKVEQDVGSSAPITEKPFIFLRVNVLREYLEAELKPQKPVGFEFNLERALDDWIFLCFFVGNDFLPHLPSLELREGAIDILIKIYKDIQPNLQGYICDGGKVNLARVQAIMQELSKIEPKIFEKRKLKEERRIENINRRKAQDAKAALAAVATNHAIDSSKRPKVDLSAGIEIFAPQEEVPSNKDILEQQRLQRQRNIEAARALKMGLNNESTSSVDSASTATTIASLSLSGATSDPEAPEDLIKLWEPGARERYYVSKFNILPEEVDSFAKTVAKAYVEGFCWVLAYYYRGCASWKWFYPYHYAPFAADMLEISDLHIEFDLGEPFRPYDQLMAVFPAASREHIPPAFHHLMTSHSSEIIDFYPEEFVIDMNGKRAAWQGVALLPFIDEARLLAALEKSYPHLTEEEIKRNSLGSDMLYTAKGTELGSWLAAELNEVDSKLIPNNFVPGGIVSHPAQGVKLNGMVVSHLSELPDFKNAVMISVSLTLNSHCANEYNFDLLDGATLPERKLTEEDVYLTRSGANLRNFPNILNYGEYSGGGQRSGHHSMHRENRTQLQRSDGLSHGESQKRSYNQMSKAAPSAPVDNRFAEYAPANIPGPYDFPVQDYPRETRRPTYSSRYNRR